MELARPVKRIISRRTVDRCVRRVANLVLPLLTLTAFILLMSGGLWAQGSASGLRSESSHPNQHAVPPRTSHPAVQEYLIAPDDVLNVYVLDVPELSRDYRVGPDGVITMPLLSSQIPAAALTLNQLAANIAEQLKSAGLVTHPNVDVTVKSSRAHAVAIAGAVKKPQIYPVLGETTILDVLSQAEGLADDAGNTAVVARGGIAMRALQASAAQDPPGAEVLRSVTVDLKCLLETGDPALNIPVYPGDRVTVQRAGIVYVVGAVNRAGGFPLKNDQEEMSVLKAVALAEGQKSTAILKKAVIIRRSPNAPLTAQAEVPVNLSKILAGKASDIRLHPNDILFIPDSDAKKALRRGAEAAIQIATGIIIWRR